MYKWVAILMLFCSVVLARHATFQEGFFRQRGAAAAPTYSMEITFSGYDRAESLTNFPVLVKLSTNNTENYNGFLGADGYELRFYTNSAKSGSELDYELELFTNASTSYVWVEIPELTNNMSIWATWGDASKTDQEAYTTNGATWDTNFYGVFHMDEVDTVLWNSASNTLAPTNMGAATNASGWIADAKGFDYTANSAYYYAPGPGDLSTGLTYSCWVYIKRDNVFNMLVTYAAATMDMRLFINTRTFNQIINGSTLSSTIIPDVGEWYYLTSTFDTASGLCQVFGNGIRNNFTTFAKVPSASTNLYIGRRNDSLWSDCLMDELQISRIARSTNWIWATYMSQSTNHETFVTYGSVTSE